MALVNLFISWYTYIIKHKLTLNINADKNLVKVTDIDINFGELTAKGSSNYNIKKNEACSDNPVDIDTDKIIKKKIVIKEKKDLPNLIKKIESKVRIK